MLGHAEAVDDGGAVGPAVQLGGGHQIVRVDVADLGHALGRVLLHHGGEGVEALSALLDESVIGQARVDECPGKAVGEGHVGAGAQLQVDVGLLGDADVARVHHAELAAALHGGAHLHADDRVGLLDVGAHHHDDVRRVGNVGDGVGHGAGAQGDGQARHGGSMAHAGAVVHVVGAEGGPCHLLQQVDVLVGRARAGEGGHGVGAGLADDALEVLGHVIERLVPAGRLQRPGGAVADEGRGEAIGRLDEVEAARAALHAEAAVVGGPVGRARVHDATVLHEQIVLAARGAVGAGSAHGAHFPGAIVGATLLHDGAGGAGRRAAAAALAARGAPVGPEGGLDGRAQAPLDRLQRVVAGLVVAGAHAALAADAQPRVEAQKRVRVPHRGVLLGNGEAGRLHPQIAAEVLQLAFAVLQAAEAEVGGIQAVVGNDQVQGEAPGLRDPRGIGAHHHGLDHGGLAGGHQLRCALHLHHAHAAGAHIAHVFQVAQGGNGNARFPGRLHDGGARGHGHGAAVDDQVRHTGCDPLPHCRSRTRRSAGSDRTPGRPLRWTWLLR